jgi:hypothetical protein
MYQRGNCPFSNLKILKNINVNILQETAEIETGMAEMSSWDQANRWQNIVWFGEIERKLAKDYLYLPFFLLIILC